MAYDEQSGVVTLVGGGGATSNQADLWQWSGSTWTEVETIFTQRPWASSDGTMVYSDDASAVVYVDPRDDTFHPKTVWFWAGAQWTRVGSDSFPSTRRDHALAFDSARRAVVLFGGHHFDDVFGDTWVFVDGQWTDVPTASAPPARRFHDMVYDEARQQVVLFGGNTSGTTTRKLANDTWTWDGSAWVRRVPSASPSVREDHAMAYDSHNELVILFGGVGWSTGHTETWAWNGTSWLELPSESSPPARREHGMAFDKSRGVTVVYGGFLGGDYLGDVWELRVVRE